MQWDTEQAEQIFSMLVDRAMDRTAEAAMRAVDLSDGKRFLAPTYGAESLADWCRQKFGVKVSIDDIQKRSGEDLDEYLYRAVRTAYRAGKTQAQQ